VGRARAPGLHSAIRHPCRAGGARAGRLGRRLERRRTIRVLGRRRRLLTAIDRALEDLETPAVDRGELALLSVGARDVAVTDGAVDRDALRRPLMSRAASAVFPHKVTLCQSSRSLPLAIVVVAMLRVVMPTPALGGP